MPPLEIILLGLGDALTPYNLAFVVAGVVLAVVLAK